MADDWDLYAVIRSCTSTTTNQTNDTATSCDETDNLNLDNNNIKDQTWPKIQEKVEKPLACLASLTFEQENNPFGFSILLEANNTNSNDPYEGLEEFFELFQNPPPRDVGVHLAPNTPRPSLVKPTNPVGNNTNTITPPHLFHSSNMPVFKVPPPPPQQPPTQLHAHTLPLGPPFNPPIRPRKRKSQQKKKTVCLVTAENLSFDIWAWRKYGQKPIKGSPYPRNYYRCSSSKGCSAKKQVERSIMEPTMFTVSYTGDHNHPRPTHRNSLAGGTRRRFNPFIAPKPESSVVYFPTQSSSLSPTTPLLTAPVVPTHEDGIDNMEINEKSGSQELVESGGEHNRASDGGDDGDDENNLLIPNRTAMNNEYVFLGFHGLGGGGFGRSPSSSDTFSGGH